ncbi:TIM44-like domain-containing protein [Roseococcus sp. SDR]|uniref:TIM44-like domain-containing protein n=1 Tax=Roseococcus sp. SDR TaxID=2835532 RepID=UPI001BCF77D6|nr:TIM44-like domain-containing protein [Roseococcus sp. SDR]MBS7791220.1 TIM44-like domain-containing protein [Roseococcus sp. SDR]MBV1846534.1 TIM44-like domain-containing protein [Roseococcus sp. SDR]
MRRTARFLTLLAAAAFVLAPALAEAAPGGRSSSGSRGARTYQAPPPTNTAPQPARPMERTATQPSAPATAGAPGAAAARPAAAPGGFFARNPMMAGLMGGLLGAGLFGLLAGGGFFSGLGSLAGILGFMLQLALIAGLVFLAMALFRRFRQQPAPAGVPNGMMREAQPEQRTMMGGGGMGRGPAQPVDEIGVQAADFQAFERSLIEINAAWSREDIAALSRLATPEMVQYFRDDYAALAQRGWKNETRDVKLEQGDLAEAWNEGARDYATVAMRMSLVDWTRDLKTGAITEGNPNARQEQTELWTFVRVQGGPWMLSAIQQTQ